jgi:hypothetical protein
MRCIPSNSSNLTASMPNAPMHWSTATITKGHSWTSTATQKPINCTIERITIGHSWTRTITITIAIITLMMKAIISSLISGMLKFSIVLWMEAGTS